jgi:hypothetical protein
MGLVGIVWGDWEGVGEEDVGFGGG